MSEAPSLNARLFYERLKPRARQDVSDLQARLDQCRRDGMHHAVRELELEIAHLTKPKH